MAPLIEVEAVLTETVSEILTLKCIHVKLKGKFTHQSEITIILHVET